MEATLAKGSKCIVYSAIAMGERGFSKNELTSKYSRDSWRFIAKKQREGVKDGKVLEWDIKSRGFLLN